MSKNGKVGSFAEVYDLFEKRCTAKGIKLGSMELYSRTMGRFCEWADDLEIAPSELQSIDVLNYTGGLTQTNGQPYKSESLRGHCKNIKTLLNFAYDYKLITEKIKVEMPRASAGDVKALTDDQLKSVLKHVEDRADRLPRNAAIVNVLKDSGLRAAELCALNWADLSWDEERKLGTIKVSKQLNRNRDIAPLKNNKPREAFFYAAAWRSLRKLQFDEIWSVAEIAQRARVDQGLAVNEWPELSEADSLGPIFRRTKGTNHLPGRLGTRGLDYMLKTVGEKLSIPLHAHLFRHTAGRLMTLAGLSPIVIAQILGHSDLAMVMRYSKLWGPDIKNVVAEAMNGNGRA